MKKTDTNESKANANHDEIKGWEGSVDFPMSEEKQVSAKRHHGMQNPMLTVGMAACLVAAPIAGLVATNVITHGSIFSAQAQAATFELEVRSLDDEDSAEADDENALEGVAPLRPAEVSEQDLDLFNVKRLGYEITGEGIIESAENIIVEPEGHTLRFVDSTKDGKISFKAGDGYELDSATLENDPVTIEGNLIIIPAGANGTLRITFMVITPQVDPQNNDNAVADNADGSGDSETGKDNSSAVYSIPEPQKTYEYEQAEPAPQQAEPAPESQEPAYEEPYYEPYPSAPAAVEGDAGMSGDELAMAHEIFDRYNDWRAAQQLPTTQWDGRCCEMAMGSARGCAERRKLIHRLGIPGDLQTSYSDILQYASWRMSGDEAVQRWANSSGHAAQMRCPTAQNAACAVYQENGIYWFAIVYTFQGTNIG